MKEIEIAKVINLARQKKYEITCAAFDLVDHIFKVDVARSLKKRKLAVQAMSLLSDGQVKYGYETDDMKRPVSRKKESAEEE